MNKSAVLTSFYFNKPEEIFWVDVFIICGRPSGRANSYKEYCALLIRRGNIYANRKYYYNDQKFLDIRKKLNYIEDILGIIIEEIERNKERNIFDIEIKPPLN